MSESQQHKLSRVRPPRVKVTYDVDTLGATQKKELPFIVGVLTDLSGKPDPETPLPRLKERQFIEIDRDNFDAVLESMGPRLAFRVPSHLSNDPDQSLNVVLNFKSMGDFSPENIVKQVAPLNELLVARNRLNDLLAKLDGNDDLDALLARVLANTTEQMKLREELQATAQATPADGENA